MRQIKLPMSTMTVAIALFLAGCGARSDTTAGSDSGIQAALVQEATDRVGSSNAVPVISERTYTSGSVQVKVSGFFDVNGSQDLNKPASITDGSQTWLQYGVSGSPGLDVTITSNETESGVVVGNGPFTLTAGSGDCKITFEVTPATVSGHFLCAGAAGYNQKTGQMGKVNVDVTFNAKS